MSEDQRFDGWKAIANFLGRERSTASRWARERGLPIHRVPGGRTGTVYALRSELEHWLASGSVDDEYTHIAAADDVAIANPSTDQRRTGNAYAAIALLLACALIAVWWITGSASGAAKAPVSIAAVASSNAKPETVEFAGALTADLARFASVSANLAVFEREPGKASNTQYAVRTEVERTQDKIVAHARVVSMQNGEVIWSRRFEQSGSTLSTLREQIAANIVSVLQCSFGTLEHEQLKARAADVALLMAICEDFGANEYRSAMARARQLTVARPDLAVGWAWLAVTQGNLLNEDDPVAKREAQANAQRAKAIGPDKACTWLAQAAVAGRGFTSPDALPFIEQGLKRHPDNSFLLSQHGLIQLNLGYVKDSVSRALNAFRNDPSSLHTRDVTVWRLAAGGRMNEALEIQLENEQLWSRHPRLLNTRNQLFRQNPALRDAILTAELDILSSPHAAYRLAVLYERDGSRQAALEWLARAPVKDARQEWSLLFWPNAAGLRTEPAFFRKMADLGLVRWWVARGQWPDFCVEPGLKYDCASEAAKLGFK